MYSKYTFPTPTRSRIPTTTNLRHFRMLTWLRRVTSVVTLIAGKPEDRGVTPQILSFGGSTVASLIEYQTAHIKAIQTLDPTFPLNGLQLWRSVQHWAMVYRGTVEYIFRQ